MKKHHRKIIPYISSQKRIRSIAFGFTILGSLIFPLLLRAQYDKLVVKSGKQKTTILGNIKLMEKNVLSISTDYSASDLKITWTDVEEIYSNKLYLVTLKGGRVLNASINTDSTKNKDNVLLWYFFEEDTAALKEIVYIKPLRKTFFSRMSASLDFGYNLTRSNNLQQLSVRSRLSYLSNYWLLSGSYDLVSNIQDGAEPIQRTNANISLVYFLQKNYFVSATSDFLQNDEQLLALRTNTRAGLGRYLIRSNKLSISTQFGPAWNNEIFSSEELGERNSFELFSLYSVDLFNIGPFSLNTMVIVYPSLTEDSRWRTDFKTDLRYDLPLNFYIKAGFSGNYDNRPIQGAVEFDYVLQTTIGWTYN